MLSQRTPISHAATESAGQAVNLTLEAELLKCADTGRLELVITTNDRAYEAGSADQLRTDIADARAQLDRMEKLATQYEAYEALQAFVDSLGAQMFEDTPEHRFPEGLGGIWYAELNATPTFIFAARMDPATRLEVARGLVARTGRAA